MNNEHETGSTPLGSQADTPGSVSEAAKRMGAVSDFDTGRHDGLQCISDF